MKDLSNTIPSGNNNPSVSPPHESSSPRQKDLGGFAKVLAGGRVVKLDRDKPFMERFIGCTLSPAEIAHKDNRSRGQVVLETVVANLEAGVKLVDKQELFLAKFGGRLTEIALSLNKARETPVHSQEAQAVFEHSREKLRTIAKETFDHTALFSNGPAKPITLALPVKDHWEGLSIDRCDLAKPGFLAIDRGKVCPHASGYLLDRESIQRAFVEWRLLCVHNLMQADLIKSKFKAFLGRLRDFVGGKRWDAPPFPSDLSTGPLRRPNLDN